MRQLTRPEVRLGSRIMIHSEASNGLLDLNTPWHSPEVANELARWFKNHVIVLDVVARVSGEPRYCAYSGFVIDTPMGMHWLTAGHVVEEINRLRSDSTASVEASAFLDSFPRAGAARICFDLMHARMWRHPDPAIDVGAVHVREGFAAQLRANPICPTLNPSIWHRRHDVIPDAFYIVGTPRQWTNARLVQDGPTRSRFNYSIRCAAIPATVIEDRHEMQPVGFWGCPDALYAQVHPAFSGRDALTDLRGVSGGPLFSVTRCNDGLRYHLWGIQSSWIESRRIAKIFKIDYFEKEYSEALGLGTDA